MGAGGGVGDQQAVEQPHVRIYLLYVGLSVCI